MKNREIDAAVDLHAFGRTWDEMRCRVCGWPVKQSVGEGCTAGSCSMRPAPSTRADEPAHYSTDPAASDKLLDRMRELGWDSSIHAPARKESLVTCQMWRGDDEGNGSDSSRHTAIAKAALVALGVEAPA